jgi:hypothetical protein
MKMKLRELIKPNELDRKGRGAIPLPGIYDKKNLDIGATKGIEVATVIVKSTKTGVVNGRRSLYQKSGSGKREKPYEV